MHDDKPQNPTTRPPQDAEASTEDAELDGPELGELAALYLRDVAEAIDSTSDADQRRPELLRLKLGFAGVVVLVDLAAALRELVEEPEGDDHG